MQPALSIVIVTYQSRNEIEACLRSLPREIAGEAVEVIVVDNASTDGTAALVREQFPEVRLVEPGTNLGFGRANNLGFASSTGDYILFLNPDTICNEVALSHCLRRLQEESSIGVISPKLVMADGAMDLACRRSIPTAWDGFCRGTGLAARFPRSRWFAGYNLTYLPEDGTYDVGAINGAFMMGRREVFEAVASNASRREKGEGRREKEGALRGEQGARGREQEGHTTRSGQGDEQEKGEGRREKEAHSTGSGRAGGEGAVGRALGGQAADRGADSKSQIASSSQSPISHLPSPAGDPTPAFRGYSQSRSLPRAPCSRTGGSAQSPIFHLPSPAVEDGGAVFDPHFFMYGDDLDLCIRIRQAGYRIVYDGSHSIIHLKGQSVARDYEKMSVAIFDANRDVYLKHFGHSAWARWKWRTLFNSWKRLALWRARRRGHRRVRPV